MKKKTVLAIMTLSAFAFAGCGKNKIALLSEQVTVELGTELTTDAAAYARLDEKAAADAAVDLTAVDIMKPGSYPASLTSGDQTVSFTVLVQDTTAPAAEGKEVATVIAGTPLTVKEVLTNVTELSGSVETEFREPGEPEQPATETAEETETAGEPTETAEGTETVGEPTETAEGTETAGESTEATEEAGEASATADTEDSFLLNGVECSNAAVKYQEPGEHDLLVVVTDASGNTTEIPLHVIVGKAPEFTGIEDLTVTVGDTEVNYLEGVTAVDWTGTDLTDRVTCDASGVDLQTVGTYEIFYGVSDENGFEAEEKAAVTVTAEKKKDSQGKSVSGSGKQKAAAGATSGSSTKKSSVSGKTSTGNGSTSASNGRTSGSDSSQGNDNAGGNTSSGNNSTSGGNGSGNNSASGNNSGAGGSISSGNDNTSGSAGTNSGSSASGNSSTGGSTSSGNNNASGGDNAGNNNSGGGEQTPSADTGNNGTSDLPVIDSTSPEHFAPGDYMDIDGNKVTILPPDPPQGSGTITIEPGLEDVGK